MTIGLIFIIIAVLGIAAILVWTFVPAVHERFKTYTTVLEAGGALLYTIMGDLTGGIQDAVTAGYVPSWIIGYLPVIFFAWFLYKRLITTTPVGTK